MGCGPRKTAWEIDAPWFGQIRKELDIDTGLVVAGERFHQVGMITPEDGRKGGTLLFRSPQCWTEWRVTTTEQHVPVPFYTRTGPASWSAMRLTSGCAIEYRVRGTFGTLVDQDTGIILNTPASEADTKIAFWLENDFMSRQPLEVLPIAGDVVPPADLEPIPASSRVLVGFTPQLTRFCFVGCPRRLNIQAVYPGSPNVLASKQTAGPANGDDSFYLGQWAALQLENLDPENTAPFKVVWSEEPGGNI
tara:strand:- start:563 stop:1309 length:747 start_codon:yes stop_codon:yes gene_type:complete